MTEKGHITANTFIKATWVDLSPRAWPPPACSCPPKLRTSIKALKAGLHQRVGVHHSYLPKLDPPTHVRFNVHHLVYLSKGLTPTCA